MQKLKEVLNETNEPTEMVVLDGIAISESELNLRMKEASTQGKKIVKEAGSNKAYKTLQKLED